MQLSAWCKCRNRRVGHHRRRRIVPGGARPSPSRDVQGRPRSGTSSARSTVAARPRHSGCGRGGGGRGGGTASGGGREALGAAATADSKSKLVLGARAGHSLRDCRVMKGGANGGGAARRPLNCGGRPRRARVQGAQLQLQACGVLHGGGRATCSRLPEQRAGHLHRPRARSARARTTWRCTA